MTQRITGDPTGEWTAELTNVLMGSEIPKYMHDGLIMYIVHRIGSGNFLMAVFENDLREACARADNNNRTRLFDYVLFLYNNAPSACWGSASKVKEWLAGKQ